MGESGRLNKPVARLESAAMSIPSKRSPIYWLRWVSVAPGALLAGILALFPLRWLLYFTLSNPAHPFIEPYPELPERLLAPFATAVVFIWTGSRIAPEWKWRTATILFGLWLCLLGAFVLLALTDTNVMGNRLYVQGGGASPAMALIGAVVGLLIARKRDCSTLKRNVP